MANESIDIAEVLAMLLPPGLVFEDPAAYAKMADLPVVPWEDIHKLWNSMAALCSSPMMFKVVEKEMLTLICRLHF